MTTAPRHRSIYWRLATVIFGGLLALLLGYWLLVLRPMTSVLGDYYLASLVREADLAGSLLEQGLARDAPPERLREVLDRHFKPAPNLSLVIFRDDGTVLYALRPPAQGPHQPAARTRVLADLASQGTHASGPGRRRRPRVVRAVPGRPGTWILATPAQSGRALVTERFPRLGLRTLSLLTVVTLLGSALALRLLTGRLRALHQGIERLAAGDPSVRLSPGTPDELGRVLTAFNQTAAALETATAEVAAQDLARREMLADVSHELRTPLTTLRGHLELLAEEPEGLNHQQLTSLRVLGEEVLALQQRVEDLLTLAREDAEGPNLVLEPCDLGQLAHDLVAAYRPVALDRKISLEAPPPADPVHAPADADRLGQVLRNLVQNALDNLAAGDHVEVTVSQCQELSILEVRDTGPGIDPEELEGLFERFRRGRGSRGAGTGLGLAIARRLTESHGGTLTAQSSLGEGSVFRIELPS